MLGNFLKIDYIVVCFLKPLNSACFLWEMMDYVANRLDFRPAAELLGGWPGSNLFAFKHKCGSRTERVMSPKAVKELTRDDIEGSLKVWQSPLRM